MSEVQVRLIGVPKPGSHWWSVRVQHADRPQRRYRLGWSTEEHRWANSSDLCEFVEHHGEHALRDAREQVAREIAETHEWFRMHGAAAATDAQRSDDATLPLLERIASAVEALARKEGRA